MQKELFAYDNLSPSPSISAGLLSGKSFIIRPDVAVCDWPTEAGSRALEGYHALEDATVIKRLKQAGASLLGSANMSELGFGLAGDRTCEALLNTQADMALMIDMMGETRVSASHIGFYGFKPTSGIVSRYGLIGLAPSMETAGILAKDPNLIAQAMAVMAGRDDRDFSMDEGETPAFDCIQNENTSLKTIGIIGECTNALDADETALFKKSLTKLRSLGFVIKELRLPDFECFRIVHHCVGAVEASSSCGKYDSVRYGHRAAQAKNWNDMYLKSRAESFGPLIKSYLFQGAYFQFQNYAAFENAGRIRSRLIKDINQLFAECNVLAFPTRRNRVPDAATDHVSAVYDEFSLTLPANVLGAPAIQIPGFASSGVTDLGLQLIGPRFGDVGIIALAASLYQSVEGGK